MAQKEVDLSAIKFNENPELLLKGISYDKTNEAKTTYYEIKDPKSCPYRDILMEGDVPLSAFQQQVVSYTTVSNLSAATNRMIKAVLATYHQPTKKITDNGDVRAWYWQTPTLFIQLMTAEVGLHDKRGRQISCKLCPLKL